MACYPDGSSPGGIQAWPLKIGGVRAAGPERAALAERRDLTGYGGDFLAGAVAVQRDGGGGYEGATELEGCG